MHGSHIFIPGRPLSRNEEYLARYPQAEVEAAWAALIEAGAEPRQFGFMIEVEKNIHRARARAQGIVDPVCVYRFAEAAYVEAHRNDETFAQWQARNSHRWTTTSKATPGLTTEEWIFLADHFAGANDPTAASILEKALAAIAPQDAERPAPGEGAGQSSHL